MTGLSQRIAALLMLLSLAVGGSSGDTAQSKPKAPKAPAEKQDPGPWLLAGREGECVPTSILGKKGPEYSDVESPYQLAEKLRAGGHTAEIKEFKAGIRPAVEVRSQSAGLAVMFVKKEHCDKAVPLPENKK